MRLIGSVRARRRGAQTAYRRSRHRWLVYAVVHLEQWPGRVRGRVRLVASNHATVVLFEQTLLMDQRCVERDYARLVRLFRATTTTVGVHRVRFASPPDAHG